MREGPSPEPAGPALARSSVENPSRFRTGVGRCVRRRRGAPGILAKYGGEEHLQAPPKEMLLSQTEHYVEYSRTGQVVKGQEPAVPKSKYEEDGTSSLAGRRAVRNRAGGSPNSVRFSWPGAAAVAAVFPNNHKTVWGSYWEEGNWGYACCGQFVKNSFCTGTAGFEARKRAIIQGKGGE